MRTLRTVAELKTALAQPRREGRRIGLVPTMGALHEGHLSLVRRARSECDVVVVSLFVNPAQFNQRSDLDEYPRNEPLDAVTAADEAVDYLFAPGVGEIYPDGFSTTVSISGITEVLEGVHRGREHFEGVATVVCKLFNIVAPDVAYFGQKDVQQTLVIKRLVRDLNIPVQIEVCPTIREPDGLALSSRNARLSPPERARALALHQALATAQVLVAAGETDVATLVAAAGSELADPQLRVDYFQIVNPETLVPIISVGGPALALVAAWVGETRLIDNQLLSVPTSSRPPAAAGSITRSD
ncbi:MAG TPA: pantoate--beta-alanine ligase [Solirubrobacteraceae bacterium]|jgi:pantoate--beta-alanine ligase|nr:pantoate--beta-alanine ligase [Solirubrobacteraceae bacterium]